MAVPLTTNILKTGRLQHSATSSRDAKLRDARRTAKCLFQRWMLESDGFVRQQIFEGETADRIFSLRLFVRGTDGDSAVCAGKHLSAVGPDEAPSLEIAERAPAASASSSHSSRIYAKGVRTMSSTGRAGAPDVVVLERGGEV
jgi:hypothetical protein